MGITDIVSWVEEPFAFLVAIESDSSAIPHLMAYMVKVVRAAKVREAFGKSLTIYIKYTDDNNLYYWRYALQLHILFVEIWGE